MEELEYIGWALFVLFKLFKILLKHVTTRIAKLKL